MEHVETEGPVAVIARRVKELRGRKGFTAQELADKLRAAGVPWDRATVTKLETRRRQSLSVVEFMALARVLDVAPVHLLVPLGEEAYQVTPEESVPASRARLWVRGDSTLRGTDPQIYYTERPIGEVHRFATLEPAAEILEPKQKGEEG
jgi:transcriptional regulator with XRE-family HTH domain